MVKQYICGTNILLTFQQQKEMLPQTFRLKHQSRTDTVSFADAYASSRQSIKLLQSSSLPAATVNNSPNTAGVTAESYHYPAAS